MTDHILLHTLATITYRFDKAVMHRDERYGDLSIGKGIRSPKEIIRHMSHVLSWATHVVQGGEAAIAEPPTLEVEQEILRFKDTIKELEAELRIRAVGTLTAHRLLQGPLADVLTHIGQLAMLSRFNDRPIEGEDFSAADIGS